ncbi:MAG TPA: twin-arginine translocase subunit TatC [Aggregatilineales bacterium]|nr:twin-arginine translocase subunit TatC [Anaerolineales bacterium]HRE48209.1 twin-arginine translocase subunit TatC [Aggregatilineales bacterium]
MATPITPTNTPANTAANTPPATTPEVEGKVMGFFDHIDELRVRFIRVVVAVVIGMILSLFITNEVIAYLARSYGQRLALTEPTDSVVTFFRVALLLGAIFAMPIITYQTLMFVLPALTRKERRWVFWAIPGTTALFLIGLLFTWFFLVPLYITFLATFQSDIFVTIWTADSYITFVTAVLFWHGAAFETPLIFYVLGRMGMVTPRSMVKFWRAAVVGAAVVAALVTPTVDPVTMSVVMVILLGLYVASIGLVAIAVRINKRRLQAAEAAHP